MDKGLLHRKGPAVCSQCFNFFFPLTRSLFLFNHVRCFFLYQNIKSQKRFPAVHAAVRLQRAGRAAFHLNEFVPLLQAVPQFPGLPLSVLPLVLPLSLSLLLFLLLVPQLLPGFFELSRQSRHRLTVSLLLRLKKEARELPTTVHKMNSFCLFMHRNLQINAQKEGFIKVNNLQLYFLLFKTMEKCKMIKKKTLNFLV